MRKLHRSLLALVAVGVATEGGRAGRAENLDQAWSIALNVNAQLQSQQSQTQSTSLSYGAARTARLPTIRNTTIDAMVVPPVGLGGALGSNSAGTTTGGGGGAGAATPAAAKLANAKIPGSNQTNFPISLTTLNYSIYTGGRLQANVDAARASFNAQRSEEFRTALDLKLTVAEAYVGVLRALRNLQVAQSDVSRLAAFARDVKNRREQGLVTRNDELAADVSLSNARLSEIQARRNLAVAWSTYNRYLCRPLSQGVDLEDLTASGAPKDLEALASSPLGQITGGSGPGPGEDEVRELAMRAMRGRPELAGLTEQARSLGFQAEATQAGIRPQVSVQTGYTYLGIDVLPKNNFYMAAFNLDWTISDFGTTRRRAAAQRLQETSTLKRRDDLAADIALEVRSRWLDVQETRLRIPVARQAVTQAEENITVVTDRYRQGLSTYTEVLDAENRRVQSFTNLYNANYDAVLAIFRLRRSVGEL